MSGLMSTTVVGRSDDVLCSAVGGQTVMMDVERGVYFGLNGSGSRLWEWLETPRSIDSLAARLAQAYEVDPSVALDAATAFAEHLLDRKLLVIST